MRLESSSQHREKEDEVDDNRDNLPAYENSNIYSRASGPSLENTELANLLDMIGIPHLTAPGEAEAQCAQLEQLGVVDAVVT